MTDTLTYFDLDDGEDPRTVHELRQERARWLEQPVPDDEITKKTDELTVDDMREIRRLERGL